MHLHRAWLSERKNVVKVLYQRVSRGYTACRVVHITIWLERVEQVLGAYITAIGCSYTFISRFYLSHILKKRIKSRCSACGPQWSITAIPHICIPMETWNLYRIDIMTRKKEWDRNLWKTLNLQKLFLIYVSLVDQRFFCDLDSQTMQDAVPGLKKCCVACKLWLTAVSLKSHNVVHHNLVETFSQYLSNWNRVGWLGEYMGEVTAGLHICVPKWKSGHSSLTCAISLHVIIPCQL